jgi:sugar lactone lactonase YvrE
MVFLYCGILTWSSTAHSAIAPVISTLSSITEGSVTPVRITADKFGNFYVTDPRGGGVLKYNSAGNVLLKISTTSRNVLGIAIANNGDVLVSQGSVVAVYSSAGSYKSSFGTFGTANGIAVTADGTVFVVDSKLQPV